MRNSSTCSRPAYFATCRSYSSGRVSRSWFNGKSTVPVIDGGTA